ncbi:MAG: glycosyltransferase 61 family protein [Sulfuriferula sp.]
MAQSINIQLLKAFIQKNILHINKSFRETSDKQWVIQPRETQYRKPAIYLENDLTRITSVGEDTTIENENFRIKGGKVEHEPTTGYSFSNVELIDGRLYGRGQLDRLTNHKKRFLIEQKSELYRDAFMACTYYGSIYFGHWLSDDLTLHLAAESLGTPVIAERKAYGHEAGYCDLFGIEQNKLSRARFDRLIMLDDKSQNSYKRLRYQTLRARLGKLSSSCYEKVYIKRGEKNARARRAVQNTQELEQFLIAQGFHIVDPDKLSSLEIANVTLGAKIVLAVEGSHMAHALYSIADEGIMCILQPPYRFNNVFKDYTDCLGLRYAFVIGVEVEGGFIINTDDLKRLLDKLIP